MGTLAPMVYAVAFDQLFEQSPDDQGLCCGPDSYVAMGRHPS
jgi:hypothetical protein